MQPPDTVRGLQFVNSAALRVGFSGQEFRIVGELAKAACLEMQKQMTALYSYVADAALIRVGRAGADDLTDCRFPLPPQTKSRGNGEAGEFVLAARIGMAKR